MPDAERFRSRQREHFETFADEYADEATDFDVHSESLFRHFLASSAPPGRRLLEIGAGGGRYTLPLLRAGYIIDAVDMSARPLERLAERARAEGLEGRLRTIVGDAEALDADGVYDLVYGIHLLHHVSDRVAMLRTMRRAARPGGAVACVEPNPLNPAWYVYITFDRLRSWKVEYGLLTIYPWLLARDYRRAGLTDVTRFMYGAVPIPLVNRWPRLLAAERVLNRVPGLRLGCAVQVVRGVRR
jgi:2-polyprenyl-3-methyl-5-hydroxy-6-metoxy-1,4-benzoquinol methylase